MVSESFAARISKPYGSMSTNGGYTYHAAAWASMPTYVACSRLRVIYLPQLGQSDREKNLGMEIVLIV